MRNYVIINYKNMAKKCQILSLVYLLNDQEVSNTLPCLPWQWPKSLQSSPSFTWKMAKKSPTLSLVLLENGQEVFNTFPCLTMAKKSPILCLVYLDNSQEVSNTLWRNVNYNFLLQPSTAQASSNQNFINMTWFSFIKY